MVHNNTIISFLTKQLYTICIKNYVSKKRQQIEPVFQNKTREKKINLIYKFTRSE